MGESKPAVPGSGAWAAKARALDRYRWLLLREQHGRLGAAVRYGRDALLDLLFGIRARLALPAGDVVAEPCDFLLLQGAPKVIALQRKKRLIETLRSQGYHLVEVGQEDPRHIIAGRMLARPTQSVPLRYFGYAAYAEWLVQRHDPQLLINDRNGSLCSPFLRLALNTRGRLLVHLAHASTVESSRRLGMNDYDYYLLFGQSSLQALQARALRFGSSRVILAGSHMIDRTFDLPPATVELRSVLLLGVGPDKEKQADYLATYALLVSWARQNPSYRVLVKRHPRSRAQFWQEAVEACPNIVLLPGDCTLAAALEQASIVVNIMSNAVIEAGLAARPVIYMNCTDDQDVLAQAQYFGPAVRSVDELARRLAEVEGAYAVSIARAQDFSKFHLENAFAGLEASAQILCALHGQRVDGLAWERLDTTITECR